MTIEDALSLIGKKPPRTAIGGRPVTSNGEPPATVVGGPPATAIAEPPATAIVEPPAMELEDPASHGSGGAQTLRERGVVPETWADLGCGSGLFTQALARLLPEGSVIYAIDKTSSLAKELTGGLVDGRRIDIRPVQADFEKTDLWSGLRLPLPDGILMANSLHYVRDPRGFLQRLRSRLNPAGQLLIVEYDTDRAVPVWVPFPVSFQRLQSLSREAGFVQIIRLGTKASVYGRGEMYGAVLKP